MIWLTLALAAPLEPGSTLQLDLTTVEGESVAVPDPDGQHIVLELIRSADW